MANRSTDPTSLVVMILLGMMTLICTISFFTTSNELTKTAEGHPEVTWRKEAYKKVLDEVTALRGRQGAALEQIALRQRELDRLEVDLTKYGVLYVGDQPIASYDGSDLTYQGVSYKSKESHWLMARALLSEVRTRLESARVSIEARQKQIFVGLEDEIDARSREQQVVLATANDMDAAYRADEEKILALKDEMEKKKAEADKTRRIDYGTRESEITKKEEHIRTLLEIELRFMKELEPDAQVLEVIHEGSQLVMNLGSRDRVIPGLLFDVFQYESGRYVVKGRAEVVDLNERIATCRIISESDARRRPIAPGDYLGSPVFAKDRAPVFVLAGEFKQFNATDIAGFITAAGGEVRSKLEPGCDYLVAGDRSDKVQDMAREFQILAMTEEQLLRYVQPRFAVAAPAAAK